MLVSEVPGCSSDMKTGGSRCGTCRGAASDCSGIVFRQFFQSLLFLLAVLPGDDQRVRVTHHHLHGQDSALRTGATLFVLQPRMTTGDVFIREFNTRQCYFL